MILLDEENEKLRFGLESMQQPMTGSIAAGRPTLFTNSSAYPGSYANPPFSYKYDYLYAQFNGYYNNWYYQQYNGYYDYSYYQRQQFNNEQQIRRNTQYQPYTLS